MDTPEALLQYIWKYRLFDPNNLQTTTGEKLSIDTVGTHNTDSGPDFFDARITIGDTFWAGNVEIHKKASDWNLHGHHHDQAYDNVVLHVVEQADTQAKRHNGSTIPNLVLPVPDHIKRNYQHLLDSELWIPCADKFAETDPFRLRFWLEKLSVRRLERKAKAIESLLGRNQNNWEESFYQLLARSLGARINAEPFEQLARSIPQTLLAKNKNNLFKLEALLFGQAGFLDQEAKEPDEYFEKLQLEFRFLQKKYGLSTMQLHQWKFFRLRPPNFPTVRIAQFAKLIYGVSHLFSQIKAAENSKQLFQVFELELDGYWSTHYNFFKPSKACKKSLGKGMVTSIIINAVVPTLFSFGQHTGNQSLKNKAIAFWEELPAENNSIVKEWERLGVHAKSAYESQALLELKNEYCLSKDCLNCEIGNKIITS